MSLILVTGLVSGITTISDTFIGTTGNANIGGDFSTGGDFDVGQNLNVDGDTLLNGKLDLLGNIDINGQYLINGSPIGSGLNISDLNNISGNIGVANGFQFQTNGVSALRLNKGGDSFYSNTFVGELVGTSASGKRKTSMGYQSGLGNTKDGQSSYGYLSGLNNTGIYQTAIGYKSGFNNLGDRQVALGYLSGINNTGRDQIALGHNAGIDNIGLTEIAIGNFAGRDNKGNNLITIGTTAGAGNRGDQNVLIGFNTGQRNNGTRTVAIGYEAGQDNTGDNSIFLGSSAGKGNTKNAQFIVSGPLGSPIIQADLLSGFVGFRTSNPVAVLDIVPTGGQGGPIMKMRPEFGANTSYSWKIFVPFDGRYRLTDDSNTDVFTITQDNNVGIGNGNPESKLDVTGNIHATGSINSDQPSLFLSNSTIFYNNVTRKFQFFDHNNTLLSVGAFDINIENEAFLLDNVGIGTNNPSTKLEVTGNITVSECIIFGSGGQICSSP